MTQRITESELGPIFHRTATRLRPAQECPRGHVAPYYTVNAGCTVCAKLSRYEFLERRGKPVFAQRDRPMRRFRDYGEARTCHEEIGGYLLILKTGLYGCSDDIAAVELLRGRAWMKRCDRIGCWDEVELTARATGGGNAD